MTAERWQEMNMIADNRRDILYASEVTSLSRLIRVVRDAVCICIKNIGSVIQVCGGLPGVKVVRIANPLHEILDAVSQATMTYDRFNFVLNNPI
jgi:hypothetical protein